MFWLSPLTPTLYHVLNYSCCFIYLLLFFFYLQILCTKCSDPSTPHGRTRPRGRATRRSTTTRQAWASSTDWPAWQTCAASAAGTWTAWITQTLRLQRPCEQRCLGPFPFFLIEKLRLYENKMAQNFQVFLNCKL